MQNAKCRMQNEQRLRQARYRQEHEDKLEERRIEKEIRAMEAMKRESNGDAISEKEQEMLAELARCGIL